MSLRHFHGRAIALVVTAACSFALAGCSRESGDGGGPAANAAPIASDHSAATDVAPPFDPPAGLAPANQDTFETALVPLRHVEVTARLDGEIVGVFFEEGRRVSAGTRLAQFDDRERRATLEERKAEAARAESAWQRAQRLYEQKLIAEEQYVAAQSEWQIAGAQRDRAAIELERCAVRTPIAGVIELRRIQTGQMAREGDMLFRIGDPDTLRAELLLPESRLGTVRAGQRVTILPAAGSPPRVVGVTLVNPLVDAGSGTFRVVIDIDNRAGGLHGGVSARVVLDAKPR